MDKKILIPSVLIILALALFFYFNKQAPPKCGIQECHGLELTCGSDIVITCDLMYAAGDNCRQYFKCGNANSECQAMPDPKFETCKKCVNDCQTAQSSDPIAMFECASKCG